MLAAISGFVKYMSKKFKSQRGGDTGTPRGSTQALLVSRELIVSLALTLGLFQSLP